MFHRFVKSNDLVAEAAARQTVAHHAGRGVWDAFRLTALASDRRSIPLVAVSAGPLGFSADAAAN